jgi:serine/threonine protein phosphatase 1
MRTIIVGDVHGCIVELNALIDRLKLTNKDRLVFAGDLVDKGPDSAGVVKRVRQLAEQMLVDVVLGNHEENHIRWMGKTPEKRSEMKRHAEFVEIHKGMSDSDREWLRTTPKLYVQVDGGLVTHAGIPEFLRQLPELGEFDKLPRKSRDLAKQMCRLRYVDQKGNFVGLYDTDPTVHTFWAERYGGQFGTVWFGHQPFMEEQPKHFPNAVGIDLGCVFGGYLCAVEVQDGVQVASHMERGREKYAVHYGEE